LVKILLRRDGLPMSNGWIGVDLDGTLAYYDKWKGIKHIGEPVPKMQERVQKWLLEGRDVRIFTARVGMGNDVAKSTEVINMWCLKHFGRILPITCEKDFKMIELWDDRCTQVVVNTGEAYGVDAKIAEVEQFYTRSSDSIRFNCGNCHLTIDSEWPSEYKNYCPGCGYQLDWS